MSTTTIDHQHDGAGAGEATRRTRLACAALAIVATSAGLGAVAQRDLGSAGKARTVTVVEVPAAVRGQIGLANGRTNCVHRASNTRVVTVAAHYPSGPCSSRSTLDSDRVTKSA